MPKEAVEALDDPVASADPASSVVQPALESPNRGLVEADLLVEDVSIDGMCGVY